LSVAASGEEGSAYDVFVKGVYAWESRPGSSISLEWRFRNSGPPRVTSSLACCCRHFVRAEGDVGQRWGWGDERGASERDGSARPRRIAPQRRSTSRVRIPLPHGVVRYACRFFLPLPSPSGSAGGAPPPALFENAASSGPHETSTPPCPSTIRDVPWPARARIPLPHLTRSPCRTSQPRPSEFSNLRLGFKMDFKGRRVERGS